MQHGHVVDAGTCSTDCRLGSEDAGKPPELMWSRLVTEYESLRSQTELGFCPCVPCFVLYMVASLQLVDELE